jgi:hypothetical protein
VEQPNRLTEQRRCRAAAAAEAEAAAEQPSRPRRSHVVAVRRQAEARAARWRKRFAIRRIKVFFYALILFAFSIGYHSDSFD